MSQAKTPDARLREAVYQEGQRAYRSGAPCPYSDWRAKTWTKGLAAAQGYFTDTLADLQPREPEPHACPSCGRPL